VLKIIPLLYVVVVVVGHFRIHVCGRSKRFARAAAGVPEDGGPAEGEGVGGGPAVHSAGLGSHPGHQPITNVKLLYHS